MAALLVTHAAGAMSPDAFHRATGLTIAFDAERLPRGDYFERMDSLPPPARATATRRIAHALAQYPPGYLARIGLRTIGVMGGMYSKIGDGHRPIHKRTGMYAYRGIWNRRDTVVVTYSESSDVLGALHHEVFHHVDATVRGQTRVAHTPSDDLAWRRALRGDRRYSSPGFAPATVRALEAVSRRRVLQDEVSRYARKSTDEDQAETARYFIENLPDALLQVHQSPTLPGSQRILHIAEQYSAADPAQRTSWDWWTSKALERSTPTP